MREAVPRMPARAIETALARLAGGEIRVSERAGGCRLDPVVHKLDETILRDDPLTAMRVLEETRRDPRATPEDLAALGLGRP